MLDNFLMMPSPPGASFNGGTRNWPAGVVLFCFVFTQVSVKIGQLDKDKLEYIEKEV